MPESAREFYENWRKGILYHRVGEMNFTPDEAFSFAEAYAKPDKERVAALEQRIAEAIAILDQAGDNRDAALAKLQEVKA